MEAQNCAELGLTVPKAKAKATAGGLRQPEHVVLTIDVSSHTGMASVEMESFDPGQIDYSKCFVVTSANVLNILGTDADWKIQYQAFKIGLPQSPQAQLRGRANSDITSFDADRGSGIRKRMLNFLRGANLTGEQANYQRDSGASYQRVRQNISACDAGQYPANAGATTAHPTCARTRSAAPS